LKLKLTIFLALEVELKLEVTIKIFGTRFLLLERVTFEKPVTSTVIL